MYITSNELAEKLNGQLEGEKDVIITQPAGIENAKPDHVTFVANPKYEPFANGTKAGVLIVSEEFKETSTARCTIRVEDPYMSFTKVLELFNQAATQKSGIDEQSSIHETAVIGEEVYVGAFTYIGENVTIGKNVRIFPNSFIGDNTVIGEGTIVYSGVNIYHHCVIGSNCILHSGVVVGSDGFGFAPAEDGSFKKIPQTGNVIIEDNVEIGANACIDRATLGSTVIKSGVKLDNLVQVAHNVVIGSNTAVAAQAGISGSTKLGHHCMVGGQAGFVGHINIAPGTRVNAQSGVTKDVSEKNTALTGSPAFEYRQSLKSQVIFRNLPALEKQLAELEQKLNDLKK